VARLIDVSGRYLKGEIQGDNCWITLDSTPHYNTNLSIRGAQLEQYALTIPGRQSYRGNVAVKIELNGSGNDVRNLYGSGEAHITEGDLGELGPVLRFATALNRVSNNLFSPPDRPRTPGKTAFDSADVAFTIARGHTTFDPIKFTGNAFSLQGRGTMNPQGNLDLRLSVLWGRDRLHIPLVSDFTREASTPLVIAHVVGTPSNPQFDIKPLPLLDEFFKALGRGRAERRSR
jgi:AsmA-like C-terminal region